MIDVPDFVDWGSRIIIVITVIVVSFLCLLWNYVGGWIVGYLLIKKVSKRLEAEDDKIEHTHYLIIDKINELKAVKSGTDDKR